MELVPVVARLFGYVSAMLVVATLVIVGPSRLRHALLEWRPRVRSVFPFLGLLAAIILIRLLTDGVRGWLAWQFGVNITGWIYSVEGPLVAALQSVNQELFVDLFVFVYLYGYVFLLVFPMIAYFALDTTDRLSELLVAFAINYGVGVVLYTAFIAYGPRNLEIAEGLLYQAYPQSRLLTDTINENVNVFPSLHTSLSVTVALFGWRTRNVYRLWFPVSVLLAVGVVLSTVYLGIHWVIDVIAGSLLAVASYYVACRHLERIRELLEPPFEAAYRYFET